MDRSDKFWFSGIWAAPLGLLLSFGYAGFLAGIRNLFRYDVDPASSFHFSANDCEVMFVLFLYPIILVLFKNAWRYSQGERSFLPVFLSGHGPTRKSLEQIRSMHPPIEKKYITANPTIGTVGKTGNKYVTVPFDPWNVQHTLVLGGPGSKKTSTVGTSLLKLFSSDTGKMVVFGTDIKPELVRRFTKFNEVHPVNFAQTNGAFFGWNMYYGLSEDTSDDELIKRFRMISNCLIVSKDKEEKNSHFTDNAKNIFAAYLFGTYRLLGMDFIDAIRKLAMIDLEQNIQQLTETSEKASHAFKLKEMLGIYSGKKSEGFEDIKTTLTTNLYVFSLDSVRYALKNNPHKACPADLTGSNPVSVFLCVPDGDLQTFAPLYTCCVEMVLRHLLDIPEETRSDGDVIPVWLLLDEVGNLPKIPSLERACALLRSRRCFVWLIVQSLKQLSNVYNESVTGAIIEDCETLMVLSAKEKETCKQIQEWCGYYREPKRSVSSKFDLSKEVSTNDSDEFRLIYDISDIRALRKDNSFLIFTDGAWFRAKKYTYRDNPELLALSSEWMRMNDRTIEMGVNPEDM